MIRSYLSKEPEPTIFAHLDPYHQPSGERKKKEELEEEAIEESWIPFLKRWVAQYSFIPKLTCIFSVVLCFIKTLERLYEEIEVEHDKSPYHIPYWGAIGFAALVSLLEWRVISDATSVVGDWGRARRVHLQRTTDTDTSLTEPLIRDLNEPCSEGISPSAFNESSLDEKFDDLDEEKGKTDKDASRVGGGDSTFDLSEECNYKAGWLDLIHLVAPDLHLIAAAFIFLLAAALMQVYIPRLTGNALDELVDGETNNSNDWSHSKFVSIIKQLVVASILGGVFAGIRGSIFTLIGGRVNVRLRVRLLESLLKQEIGFFDVTKTGDITSRLCSDTTLVGDQVSLNVNVFLRSTVQAIGVLIFMFFVSWQLTLLTFLTVPVTIALSTIYGEFVSIIYYWCIRPYSFFGSQINWNINFYTH